MKSKSKTNPNNSLSHGIVDVGGEACNGLVSVRNRRRHGAIFHFSEIASEEHQSISGASKRLCMF